MIQSLEDLSENIQAIKDTEYRDIFNDIMLVLVLSMMRTPEECQDELEEYFNAQSSRQEEVSQEESD